MPDRNASNSKIYIYVVVLRNVTNKIYHFRNNYEHTMYISFFWGDMRSKQRTNSETHSHSRPRDKIEHDATQRTFTPKGDEITADDDKINTLTH